MLDITGKKIYTDKDEYQLIKCPNHPFKDANGLVRLHRLVVEDELTKKYGIEMFLLPYFDVHHINGKKDDNRPENLQIMTKREHSSLKKIDTSDRSCKICGKKDDHHWRTHPITKEEWYCNNCHGKIRHEIKMAKRVEERLAFLQLTTPRYQRPTGADLL